MQELAELERRITLALDRIAQGIQTSSRVATQGGDPATDRRIAQLQSALDEERAQNGQLAERLRQLKDAAATERANLIARLEVQGAELGRMSRTLNQMTEEITKLRTAINEGTQDAQVENRAALVELEAMRAARSLEIAELKELLCALAPFLKDEEPPHA